MSSAGSGSEGGSGGSGRGEGSGAQPAGRPDRGAGPPGRLVLVATPIGNLGDLSPRAVATLAEADVVCCEDTRRTRALLAAAGVPAGRRLVSLHEHNEASRIPQVLGWLDGGRTVAVVTDAGTPGVSDPGERLVAAVAAGGLAVSTVPGPSAVLAALVVSGLPTDRFCVEGFLPRKGPERRRRLAALAAEERTAVVLEAPGRVAATLAELARACDERAAGGAADTAADRASGEASDRPGDGGAADRPVAVVRELTKIHEEVWRGTLPAAAAELADRPPRGEVVLVLGGAPAPAVPSDGEVAAAVAERLAAGDGARQAAEAVAAALGVPRRRAYELAIGRPGTSGRPEPEPGPRGGRG